MISPFSPPFPLEAPLNSLGLLHSSKKILFFLRLIGVRGSFLHPCFTTREDFLILYPSFLRQFVGSGIDLFSSLIETFPPSSKLAVGRHVAQVFFFCGLLKTKDFSYFAFPLSPPQRLKLVTA